MAEAAPGRRIRTGAGVGDRPCDADFRGCRVVIHDVLSSSVSVGCEDGSKFCDADRGSF